MDRARKNAIKTYKEISFKSEIQTHLKVVNFLANGRFRPYKKSKNVSEEEIVNASKYEYQTALKITIISKPN